MRTQSSNVSGESPSCRAVASGLDANTRVRTVKATIARKTVATMAHHGRETPAAARILSGSANRRADSQAIANGTAIQVGGYLAMYGSWPLLSRNGSINGFKSAIVALMTSTQSVQDG